MPSIKNKGATAYGVVKHLSPRDLIELCKLGVLPKEQLKEELTAQGYRLAMEERNDA